MGLACLNLLLVFLCVVMDSTLLPDWLIEAPHGRVRISCRSVVLRIYSCSCCLTGKVDHTVLLRSDGSAVAWGCNRSGQCNIPDLVESVTYTQVDTGYDHTVLLASDGTAVACGGNYDGQCNVPALSDGVIYTQVAIGGGNTFLLKSNGTVVACGRDWCGQCNIPILPDGVVYDQVAAGSTHTVLLKSDGTVTTCGKNDRGQCNIPTLATVSFTHMSPQVMVTRYC